MSDLIVPGLALLIVSLTSFLFVLLTAFELVVVLIVVLLMDKQQRKNVKYWRRLSYDALDVVVGVDDSNAGMVVREATEDDEEDMNLT